MCERALWKGPEVTLNARDFLLETNRRSKLSSLSRPPQRQRDLGAASKSDVFSGIGQSDLTCTCQTLALPQSVVQHRSLLANAAPTFASTTGLVISLNLRLGHAASLCRSLPRSPCSPRPPSTPPCPSPPAARLPSSGRCPFPAPQGLTQSTTLRGSFLGPSVTD